MFGRSAQLAVFQLTVFQFRMKAVVRLDFTEVESSNRHLFSAILRCLTYQLVLVSHQPVFRLRSNFVGAQFVTHVSNLIEHVACSLD